jgi:transcription initiation factor TFIID subunit 1, fungi type
MVTPEMVCLYESMLVGQRHLLDAGYGKAADGDEETTEENESKLDIEEQLAPWITTRNFLNATQGKAMLKLYGPGDPTGRGEGFSFIRVSMKDIFLRAGESAEEKLGMLSLSKRLCSLTKFFHDIAQIEARPKSAHRYNVAEQQQVYKEEVRRLFFFKKKKFMKHEPDC